MPSNQTRQAPPNFQNFGELGPFFPPTTVANVGTIGDTAVGRVDVRTPLMQMLESMLGQTAFNLFQNPFAFSQHAQALPGVGGVPQQTAPNFEGIPGALGTDPLQQAFAQAFSGLFGGGSAPLTGQPGRQGGQPQPRQTFPGFPGFGPISIPTGSDPGIPWPGDGGGGGGGRDERDVLDEWRRRMAEDDRRERERRRQEPTEPDEPIDPRRRREPVVPIDPYRPDPGDPRRREPFGPGIPKFPQIQLTVDQQIEQLLASPEGTQQLLNALGFGGGLPPYINSPNALGTLFGQKYPSGLPVEQLAWGGQLDPRAVNIVGEFGPEMVVGNQVIPFGNRPVGLSPIEEFLRGEGARYAGSASALGSLFGPQVEQYLGSPEGSRYVGSPSALGSLFAEKYPSIGLPAQFGDLGSAQQQAPPPTRPPLVPPQPPRGPGGPGQPQIPASPIPQFNFGQLPQFPQLPQVGGFQPGTLQGAGTGAAQRFLEANPEQQTFNLAQNQLQPLISGGGAAQGIMGALQPLFQRNLQFGLGELRNLAPSTANQALQRQGTDLTAQALQDYNLLSSQALQQGQQTQLQSLGLLGQLAGQAGQAPFGRALQAGQLGLQESQAQTAANQQAAAQNAQNLLSGFQAQSGQALGAGQLGLQGLTGLRGQDIQREYGLRQLAQQQSQFANTFGLQAQQQAFEQQTNPSLQLLLALLGLAQPTGYQTIASQG